MALGSGQRLPEILRRDENCLSRFLVPIESDREAQVHTMVRHGLRLVFMAPMLALAQRPEVAWGGGSCSNDWDCSLGGECVAEKCKCDIWFTGPNCDLLNLQAPESTERGLCHSGFDSYYSWGGRAIPEKVAAGPGGPAKTRWHLYASFMCKHCSLRNWTTVSSSGHFVSDSPVGPFKFSPEQCNGDVCTPTIIPWSHNTVAARNIGGSDDWQIWHIGDDNDDPSVFGPCFNSSEVGPANPPLADETFVSTSKAPNPGAEVFIATAETPSGPWKKAFDNKPLPIRFPSTGAWPQSATNPSPLEMPDGSVNLYFTCGDDDNPCGLVSNCIGVATSKNGWEGPFEANTNHLTNLESEDAHVFRDPRGNYHMLTNINTCHRRCPIGVECGGHSWSRDGVNFSNLTVGAFGPYVTLANGTGWNNSYSERPLVTQNEDGTPLAFYVGMGRTSYMDCCNWPMLFCTGAPGEKCGPMIRPQPAGSKLRADALE